MKSEFKSRLDEIIQLLEQMAGGDLEIRLPLSAARDELDAVAFGINLLADEVQFKQHQDERYRLALESTQSELKATLKELQKTHDQLVHSAKLAAIGELCAGIAHEINNPLTIIQGHVEKLDLALKANRINSEEVASSLSTIGRSISRITGIISSVKAFARPSASDFKSIDISSIVESCLSLLQSRLQLKQIQVNRRYSEPITSVLGDGPRLEQVILNVLTNAIDAIEMSERNIGNIDIVLSADAATVRLEVCDDGVGLERSLVSKVFDPFFTTKEVGRGTGLGLSISHSIIKDHRGMIEFSSRPGHGSTVRIQLPRGGP